MPETGFAGVRAVLFDFDGTLADTAPDLAGALNRLRREHGLDEMPLDTLRPHASSGARGLLGAGLRLLPGHTGYEAMRTRFLELYAAASCVETRLFPGIAELLAALEARALVWGIVTNKTERLTHPILAGLGLAARARCVVGGDTTPHPKPHPAPLLHAAHRLGLAPGECCYVGDDRRDIEAARAAGMPSVAVRYGYLGVEHADPAAWGADALIDAPAGLLALLPPLVAQRTAPT